MRRLGDSILLVLRTGMQWNALSATGVCSSSSAHRRFQEWEQAGVFHEIWRQGLLEYDEQVGIDWSFLAADGALSKAPLGGPKRATSVSRRCFGDLSTLGIRCIEGGRRERPVTPFPGRSGTEIAGRGEPMISSRSRGRPSFEARPSGNAHTRAPMESLI